MEINETTILDDRGFIQISGDEAKEFLQNIVTNDVEKVSKTFPGKISDCFQNVSHQKKQKIARGANLGRGWLARGGPF